MQTFSFCLRAFRFWYAAVFVLTLLSCRNDGELEPMTVQWSRWHFWYLGEWNLFETVGKALFLPQKAANQLAFLHFKVASCWNKFACWSVLWGCKFWKPAPRKAVLCACKVIVLPTSMRHTAFEKEGSSSSGVQLCTRASGDGPLQRVLGCARFIWCKSEIVSFVSLTQPTSSHRGHICAWGWSGRSICVNSPFFSLGYQTVASAIYDFKAFSILQPLDNVETAHPRSALLPVPQSRSACLFCPSLSPL